MDLLPQCSVMESLDGCRVKVVTAKNLGLVLGVFFSLSLSLFSPLTWSSSSSPQSYDIGKSFGHVFPIWVYIAQYVETSEDFVGASCKVGDNVDSESIGWLVCMGPRLVVVSPTYLALPRVAA